MKDWIGLLARLVTGGVWVVAGAIKLPEPRASVEAVKAYEILPHSAAETVGYLLPAIEIVIGTTLILGLLTRFSAIISALLFIAFIVGIASAWSRGLAIDCGCFGGGGYVDPDEAKAKYPWEIARDAGLLIASAWLIWRPRSRFSLDSVLFPKSTATLES